MKKFRWILLISGLLVLPLAACRPDSSAEAAEELRKLRHEVLSLKQLRYDIEKLQQEVASLKPQMSPGSIPVPTESAAVREIVFKPDGSHRDDPFLGPKGGTALVMAFGDFQCRPCRDFYAKTLPQLRRDFVDAQKVKFVYRDFPVGSHTYAARAAQLAHCAGEQGRYWDMFALLFEHGEALDAGKLPEIAAKLKQINRIKLDKCLASTRYQEEVERDVAEGKKLGAKGAPAFFVGIAGENQEFKGVFIRGAQPYGLFRAELEKILLQEANAKAQSGGQ